MNYGQLLAWVNDPSRRIGQLRAACDGLGLRRSGNLATVRTRLRNWIATQNMTAASLFVPAGWVAPLPPATIAITAPLAGASLTIGRNATVRWTAMHAPAGAMVNISILSAAGRVPLAPAAVPVTPAQWIGPVPPTAPTGAAQIEVAYAGIVPPVQSRANVNIQAARRYAVPGWVPVAILLGLFLCLVVGLAGFWGFQLVFGGSPSATAVATVPSATPKPTESPRATSTAMPTSTNMPTNTNTPTPTNTNTATATATNTNMPTNTNTATATATNTNTPTPTGTVYTEVAHANPQCDPYYGMYEVRDIYPVNEDVTINEGEFGMTWWDLTVNGTKIANNFSGRWLGKAGTYNIRTPSHVRILQLPAGTNIEDVKRWWACDVYYNEGQYKYDWKDLEPSSVGSATDVPQNIPPPAVPTRVVYDLDRHGCPDSPGHFMDQKEDTLSPVPGPIVLKSGQVAMVWGVNLKHNGVIEKKAGHFMMRPGSYDVSVMDGRMRRYYLNGSSEAQFKVWATCFVGNDEPSMKEWAWDEIVPSAVGKVESNPQPAAGYQETQNVSPVNGVTVNTGEICAIWWQVKNNGVQVGANHTGIWFTKPGPYNVSSPSRFRCWKTSDLAGLRAWWEPQVPENAKYTWLVW